MFWNKLRRHPLVERFTRLATILRWGLRLLLILLIVDLFYLAVTWPDWKKVATGAVPKSNFISDYEKTRVENKELPRLRWQPVPLSTIPKHVVRAVIVAEDSRFYEHSGFDLVAFKDAMHYNFAEGRFALGASTISQQTVKNLFLSASKNPLRKWHELILTWGMEQNLSKARILEIYLNDAEFGTGIFGVQAAAQAYWGVDVGHLSAVQAAELAATLPSPLKNNPATRTKPFENRSRKILSLLARFPGDAAEALTGITAEPGEEVLADDAAEPVANPDTPRLASPPPLEERAFGRNAI
jgi:monofunctional biosynthetic peptidoglycan transglycosylase